MGAMTERQKIRIRELTHENRQLREELAAAKSLLKRWYVGDDLYDSLIAKDTHSWLNPPAELTVAIRYPKGRRRTKEVQSD